MDLARLHPVPGGHRHRGQYQCGDELGRDQDRGDGSRQVARGPTVRAQQAVRVIWLTAQHGIATPLRGRLAAAGAAFDFIAAALSPVHIVEPELYALGLPVHDFRHDLQRLERELSNADKVSVAPTWVRMSNKPSMAFAVRFGL